MPDLRFVSISASSERRPLMSLTRQGRRGLLQPAAPAMRGTSYLLSRSRPGPLISTEPSVQPEEVPRRSVSSNERWARTTSHAPLHTFELMALAVDSESRQWRSG
jgi:hypothetical protein